jgi:hypothetical protein
MMNCSLIGMDNKATTSALTLPVVLVHSYSSSVSGSNVLPATIDASWNDLLNILTFQLEQL